MSSPKGGAGITIIKHAREATPPAETVPAIAQRLRVLREVFRANQAAFCRRVGIAQNTWNQYESGRGRPSLDFALRVRARTGATLDWIFAGAAAGLPHDLALEITEAQERLRAAP